MRDPTLLEFAETYFKKPLSPVQKRILNMWSDKLDREIKIVLFSPRKMGTKTFENVVEAYNKHETI